MEVSIESPSKLERKLTITIPVDIIKEEYDKIVRKNQNKASLPGFRAGKVPRKMLEKRFHDSFKSEVVENIIPTYVEKAVEEHNLSPVATPQLTTGIDLDTEKDFSFEVEFEVKPEINVDYVSLFELEKEENSVTSESIQEEIVHLRRAFGKSEQIDGSSETDDVVNLERADEEGKTDKNSNLNVLIGAKKFPEDLHKIITGLKKGDKISIPAKLVDEFSDQENEELKYEYTIKTVSRTTLAEINEALFEQLQKEHVVSPSVKNVEDLEKTVEMQLKNRENERIISDYSSKVIEQVYDKLDFEVPSKVLTNRVDYLNKSYIEEEENARMNKKEGEESKPPQEIDMEALKTKAENNALNQLRTMYFIDHIFESEKLSVNRQILMSRFVQYCNMYGVDPQSHARTDAGKQIFQYFDSIEREQAVLSFMIRKKYGENFLPSNK